MAKTTTKCFFYGNRTGKSSPRNFSVSVKTPASPADAVREAIKTHEGKQTGIGRMISEKGKAETTKLIYERYTISV